MNGAVVIPLPTRQGAEPSCMGCRIPFQPAESHHRLCPRCHAGAAAFLALRRARRLLTEGA
jgi:Zn finger protein HypA/HybF involved in hydrogenase expression